MTMLMPSYINTRDTIIQPNDAFEMDITLLDFLGFPVDLRDSPGVKELRFTVVSEIGGWFQTSYNSGAPRYNSELSSRVEVLNAQGGRIKISVDADVLNIYDGYTYTVQMKPRLGSDAQFKSVARGRIEIFNRPSGF